MENIQGTVRDGQLFIAVSGRIDSNNAAEAEQAVNAVLAENPQQSSIVLDAEKLEYISSAGLRVILRLRKQYPDIRIINVVPEVYEIFEMTGFSEMIPIEKAYRHLSIEGCEVIGQGANGKVYRLDPETIIKVYRNADALPDIQRERELARKAFVQGIPTAIPYDVVRVGDSYGSVFELLNAKSLSKIVAADPGKLEDCIRLFVDLMKKIHGTEVQRGSLPDMKAVAVGWAAFLSDYLPKETSDKLNSLMQAVPERNTMLHGDYHFKNVMVQDGEALLIDMDTLSMGHPVFELASMYLGFVGFGETDPEICEKFMGLPYDTCNKIWSESLRLYFNGDDEKAKAAESKARIVGYTRLMRRTIRRDGMNTESGQGIIGHCGKCLEELVAETDSLDF